MTSREKIRFGYNVFLSVLTGAVGLAYILSAANLYYSGPVEDGANLIYYSREIVWGYLKWLLIPTAIWIVAIIGGFVLSVVVPSKSKKRKQSALTTVNKLKKRVPEQAEGELAECLRRVKKGDTVRLAVRAAIAIYCVIAAVMCGIYVFNASNFPADDLSGEVLKMLAHILPWVTVAFVLCCGAAIYDGVSAKYLLPDIKRLVASKGEPKKPCAFLQQASAAGNAASSPIGLGIIRTVVAVVGVLFLVVGIVNGGAEDVLAKAVNICTECIGLG